MSEGEKTEKKPSKNPKNKTKKRIEKKIIKKNIFQTFQASLTNGSVTVVYVGFEVVGSALEVQGVPVVVVQGSVTLEGGVAGLVGG